jgi:hypothetical protein
MFRESRSLLSGVFSNFVEKFVFACFLAVISAKALFFCKYVISAHLRTFYLHPIDRLPVTY